MFKKIKKLNFQRIENFIFRFPSVLIVLFLIFFSIFILCGGLYDIMEKPISVLPTPTNPIFYYRGLSEQTLNESLIFFFLLTTGISGVFLISRSLRYIYRPREVRLSLLLGLLFLSTAFLGIEILFKFKGI